jgi:hypothetical protein
MEIQTKSSTTKAGRPPSLVLIDEQLWRNRRVARMATRTVKEHRCGTPMVSLWEKHLQNWWGVHIELLVYRRVTGWWSYLSVSSTMFYS